MTEVYNSLLQDLQQRELIAQTTAFEELGQHLNEQSRAVYCGFDPTADSLHLGHLVPLLALKRFQMSGHQPIALVGGATGLIGDPSFKASERKLNREETVAHWVEKIKKQAGQFVDFDCGRNSAIVVNNLDWTQSMSALDFLRGVGKYFSVNSMINKESVKQRIDREGSGISFTEFSYALLQGLDFAELNQRYNCTLQIGGSDQWGNIVGGIDLARKLYQARAYGLTVPLITKSDGTKFGKTEGGTIWLDSSKTSPYAFYQFWLNTSDSDVYRFLKFFTFLSIQKINEIEQSDKNSQAKPEAQNILAQEVTRLVHGEENLNAVKRISDALFLSDIQRLSLSDLEQLQQDGMPSATISATDLQGSMSQLFFEKSMVKSGKQVKDMLSRDAVFINGVPRSTADNMRLASCFSYQNALYDKFFVVQLGKKNYFLFELI